jgi:hypothetical protein
MQRLLFRMNLHYKPGWLRDETINFSINRWKRKDNLVVNRLAKFSTIGVMVTIEK